MDSSVTFQIMGGLHSRRACDIQNRVIYEYFPKRNNCDKEGFNTFLDLREF